MFSRVKGTEDFLNLRLHNFVLSKTQQFLQTYNFNEIQTPILEYTNLFVRSLGTETDVVTKEMYTFNTSSGESICLRPEMTASTMRAFLEVGMTDQTPWKVFSTGAVFRHERPQKGRWRQFSQINIEIIGTNSIFEDAHFIKMLDRLFSEEFLVKNYVLKLNFLGTLEERKAYSGKLYEYLNTVADRICSTCMVRKEKNILRIFDCKNESCKTVYSKAPKLTDSLGEDSKKEWDSLRTLLDILSVNFVHDTTLVRGLDYYNKTVFEFVSFSDSLGSQNAFCGGGQWELAQEFGAKHAIPSVGAAIGLGRLLMLLDQDQLQVPQTPALHLILPMSQDQQELALLLAYDLQTHNICTDILFEEKSMKNMMRKANKMGAKYVLILGEEEQNNGTVTLKNMITGEQKVIKQTEVIGSI